MKKSILLITVLITMLTQMPSLIKYNGYFKIILLGLWVVCLGINILKDKLKVDYVIVFAGIFNIFIFINSIFNIEYLKSTHFNVINIAILYYFVGKSSDLVDDFKFRVKILKVFIIATGIIAIEIYLNYFLGVDLINQKRYLYSSKNSIGAAMVFSVFFILYFKEIHKKFIYKVLLIIFVIMLFIMQNRTGMMAIIIYCIFLRKKTIRINKNTILIFLLSIIIFSIYRERIIEFLEWSFQLNKYNNLNDLSSGRLELIGVAIKNFSNNFMIGIPTYYIDNSIICLFTEYGILGGSIVIIFLGKILCGVIKRKKENYFIYSFTILAFFIGIFEALPPFGPGAIYFIFWINYGASNGKRNFREGKRLNENSAYSSILQ